MSVQSNNKGERPYSAKEDCVDLVTWYGWTASEYHSKQGRNYGWKVELKAAMGVGCGRGSPPPAVRVRGITPGKFTKKNSDAKSCILVTTCCEISCFLKTTANKLGETNTFLVPPTQKLEDQSPPASTVVALMTANTMSLSWCHLVLLSPVHPHPRHHHHHHHYFYYASLRFSFTPYSELTFSRIFSTVLSLAVCTDLADFMTIFGLN